MKPLVNVYRGDLVESVHHGSIAIVDARGSLLAYAGEPSTRTCLRSSAKPFQAIPLLEFDGAEEFELSGEELALTCASHGGEAFHVATAAALLRKGEFDESDLLCGAHAPFDEKSAADLRASGEAPSPLHNNCSGKHAGMLLAALAMDVAPANYIAAEHPVQQAMRSTVSEFAGLTADDVPVCVDGCGVPAFYLTLYRAAFAYARLMASASGTSFAGAMDRYAESASRVVDAMTSFPEYVAGSWSITTPLMRAYDGELLAKEGAEGFYAMALSPELSAAVAERLQLATEAPLGIALKVSDGSMTRGRNPVIIRLLDLLGLEPRERPDLARYIDWKIRNVVGLQVGEARAEFELQLL